MELEICFVQVQVIAGRVRMCEVGLERLLRNMNKEAEKEYISIADIPK